MEAGMRPIGVAEFLAQHQVQPGTERTPHRGGRDIQGRPAGVVPVGTGTADPDIGLDRLWAIDDPYLRCGGIHPKRLVSGRLAALPASETVSHQFQGGCGQVAGQHDGGRCRPPPVPVETGHVIRGDGGHRAADACGGTPGPGAGIDDRALEAQRSQVLAVHQALLDLGQPKGDLTGHIGIVEGRLGDDLGQEIKGTG